MPVFDAGAVVGHARLETGNWSGRVKQVIADSLGLKRNLAGIGDGAKTATPHLNNLQNTLSRVGQTGHHHMARIKTSSQEASHSLMDMAMSASSVGWALSSIAGGMGLTLLTRQFVRAAAEAENLKIVFTSTLGSEGEANRIYAFLADYAARVTLTFQETMRGAVALSSVLTGGREQLQAWIPIVGDLAAYAKTLGISTEEAFIQIVRMLSAGAAAADLFREKGINALLGFRAGVQYTAEETARQIVEKWSEAGSRFSGMAEKLSTTWDGQVSMMIDRWYLFRNVIMDTGLYRALVSGLTAVNRAFDSLFESMREWLEAHGAAFTRAAIAVTAVSVALAGVIAAKVGLWALTAAFGTLGATIGLTALPAAALVAALVVGAALVATHWEETKATVAGLGEAINEAYGAATRFLGNLVQSWTNAITRMDAAVWDFAADTVEVWGRITSGAKAAALFFKNAWLGAQQIVLTGFLKMTQGLAALPMIGDYFAGDLASLQASVADLGAEIEGNRDKMGDLWGSVSEGVQATADHLRAMADAGRDMLETLTDPAEALLDQADAAARSAQLFRAMGAEAEKGGDLAGGAVGAVTGALGQAKAEAQGVIDMFQGIGEGADEASEKAKKAAEKLTEQANQEYFKLVAVEGAMDDIVDRIILLQQTGKWDPLSQAGLAQEILDKYEQYPKVLDPIIEGVGEWSEDLQTVLATLRKISLVTGIGKAGDELVEGLRESEFQDMLARVNEVQQLVNRVNPEGELLAWMAQIGEYEARLSELPQATRDAVALELWQQLGKEIEDKGRRAVEDFLERVRAIDPEMAVAFEGASSAIDKASADWAKSSSDLQGWAGVADNIGRIGNAVGQLGPKFQKAAQAAKVAQDAIALAMAPDPVSKLIAAVQLAADAMGLFGDKTEEVKTGLDRVLEEIGNSVEGWADQMADAIVEFAQTGKFEFKELVDSILSDMLRITIKYGILQPLFSAFGMEFAKGGAFDKGRVVSSGTAGNIIPFARGGVVTRPTVFPMAGGAGLMGEQGPEAVVPLKRLRDGRLGVSVAGGAANVPVVINFIDRHVGEPINLEQTGQSVLPDGTRQIDVVITNVVNQGIRTGRFDKSMGGTFGLQRRGAR